MFLLVRTSALAQAAMDKRMAANGELVKIFGGAGSGPGIGHNSRAIEEGK